MWQWLVEMILRLFGIEPDKVSIKGRVSMPLFYPKDGGGVCMTWDYLNKTEHQQDVCRWWIKHLTADGETPAIAFLLSPPQEAGTIFLPWPTVHEANLELATQAIKKCVDDGIAVFPVLYTDDKAPWWYDIRKVCWSQVHESIGKHVNGYILSIETNEVAQSVGQIQDCIAAMEEQMPGVEYYGVHLQWNKTGRYRWLGGDSTPFNANLILAETSWHPRDGDKAGFEKLKAETQAIIANNPNTKICLHEYNWSNSTINEAQRAMLRELDLWGQG
ncbi:MAG: hypothetical protein PHU12_04215 [Candidatus Aenigmarchaeota archaeon]|nr:hypothetical protein [Candidatus Aenigmarchaeota archaeon]